MFIIHNFYLTITDMPREPRTTLAEHSLRTAGVYHLVCNLKFSFHMMVTRTEKYLPLPKNIIMANSVNFITYLLFIAYLGVYTVYSHSVYL